MHLGIRARYDPPGFGVLGHGDQRELGATLQRNRVARSTTAELGGWVCRVSWVWAGGSLAVGCAPYGRIPLPSARAAACVARLGH